MRVDAFNDVDQAVILHNLVDNEVEKQNLPGAICQSFSANLNSSELINLSIQDFLFKRNNTYFFLHLNICSLQSHFDELNELILKFPIVPSIICLSETRINIDLSNNINIPRYMFIYLPSSIEAGGVSAYISNALKFVENDYLRLNISWL